MYAPTFREKKDFLVDLCKKDKSMRYTYPVYVRKFSPLCGEKIKRKFSRNFVSRTCLSCKTYAEFCFNFFIIFKDVLNVFFKAGANALMFSLFTLGTTRLTSACLMRGLSRGKRTLLHLKQDATGPA